MKVLSLQHLVLGITKNILAIAFLFAGSLSFGQTTENYDGAGTANNQVLANGFAAFDYGGFTYQIISFNGTNSSLLDILNWETYGNNGTDAIGVSGAINDKITVFKLTKTDGSAFSTSSLWMTSAGDSYTITGYNDGNTTGQSVSVSASFSGIKTLNFTGVDELRFEGTEIIVDLDDFTYTLGATNSAPTATAPSAPTVSEDDTNVALADNIQVSDTDGDSQTVSFTITGGTLSIGTTGITFGGGNGSASFTAAGTLAAINTALDAATFTPTPNLSGSNVATISFTTNDGKVSSTAASVTFNITEVNDDPSILGLPTDITVSEDIASNVDLLAATFSDVDAGANSIVLTIAASTGTLSASSGGLVTIGGSGTGTLSLTGTAANIDIYLNTASNIKYTGALNVNGNNAATLTLSANDGGNTGSGGGTDVALGTVNVDITAINDDPSISGLPTDVTVSEDITGNVDLSAATFNDVDAGSNSIVLTIATSTGTLSASSGGSVTIGGSGTGTLSLTGAAADIDTYLNTASNIKYTGAPNVNGNDAATLTLTANDGGNTGSGSGTEVSLGTVNVDITAVNDKPTASDFTKAIYEGTPYVFATGDFGYSDVDGDALVKITFNWVPENGILYIDADNGDDYDAGEELDSGENVSKANLDNGNLQYLNTDGISSYFEFVVNDGITYSVSISTATLTVTAEPMVTLSLDPSSSIAESLGTTNVKATISHSFNKDVTVNLLVSGSAIGSGTDYTLPASSIVISAGNTSNSIQLSSVSDHLDEDDETVIIDISSVTNGTESGIQQVTCTLTDDDNTPVITASQSFSISENIANSGLAGTILATDGDAGTSFSAWTETGGTGASIFEINASTGAITVTNNGTIDRESTASYTYTVTVSDGTNTSAAETIAINITDINDVTPVITSSQSFSVDEDAANATSVGTVLATDGDATATVFSSWTITAGNTNSVFAINSSTGEITVNDANELDYESITSYSLSITVSDGVNTSTAETVVVDLKAINDEIPVFTSASTINIDENTTDVITLTATDGDAGTTFTFNKIGGDDQALFSINSSTGELAFTSSPDYETPLDVNTDNDYIVEVSVSDGLNSSTQTITVSVDNVTGIAITSNGGGATAEISIPENSTSIATVTSVNEGVAVPLYSLIGGADQAKFNIHPTSGLLNFVSAPDYELAQDVGGNNSYEVIVRVTGDVGATDDQTITVTITDMNDVIPVITASQSFSVNEDAANTTSVGTVLATDGDAASTTYSSWSITDGNTDGIFAVNSTTGEITVTDNTNLDFETQTTYSLRVTVSDGTNTSVAETVIVNVNDVNDNSPIVTASQIFNIAEDIADSGTVGTVLATDADAGTAFSAWTETGGTGASIFEINASTGAITVTDNSGLDYETTTSYSYTVTVSDGTNTSAAETITINITDVNDVAPVITASQTFNIDENSANATSVGTVLATDSDAGTTLTDWTIISGNEDGIFTITPSTGEITIVDNTNLDFERDEIYDLLITVKDGENTSLEGTVRISVIDINESPTAIQLSNAAIAENSAIGTEVGTLTASDEDKDPTLSFSMAQNEFFELHGDKIVSKEIFDYEDHISYLIQVNVEDQGGLSHGESFTIQIENKNEAPRFISEPFVDAVLNKSYTYMIKYQDVDAEGCIVTAFEKPSWLNLDDNGDGTATLYGLPTEAGTFNVILEAWDNEYLARQEFKIIVETVTGIEDVLTAPIVQIYPNPVVQELHIDLSDLRNDETTISLFSMTGSLIFKEEHKNIGGKVRIVKSVQQLRSGIYLLLIEWEGYQKSYKIVKE